MTGRTVALTRWLDGEPGGSEVFWPETCALRDPSQHSGPDFFIVVECKHEIGPPIAGHRAMRAGLSLDRPSDLLKRCKYPPGPGAWPIAHAALKAIFRRLGPSSP